MSASVTCVAAVLSATGNPATSPARFYIPALDGLRAVAILMVLFCHWIIYLRPAEWLAQFGLFCGETGVSVFFVISGYLITTLLLREERQIGAINLRQFYVRRILRIFPAAYAFLAVVLVLMSAGVIQVPLQSYVASVLYVRNIAGWGHETAHLWSLSLEEQFYLLWPAFLVWAPARRRIPAVLTMISAVCAWRTLCSVAGLVGTSALYTRTDMRMDTILAGCALALLAREARFHKWIARAGARGWLLASFALLGFVADGWTAASTLGKGIEPSLVAIALVLIVNWVLQHPQSVACRILEQPAAVWIGKLSYSLYLWHMLFLGPAQPLGLVRQFPLNFLLTFLAAAASYYSIERPALRLKDSYFQPAPALETARA